MSKVAKFMMKVRVLAAAFVFSVAACAPAQLTANTLVPEQKPVEEQARLDCVAKGGKIRPVCRAGRLMCVVAYPDAGKVCDNNADCLSNKCVADPSAGPIGAPVTGKCKVTNDPCGCVTTVKNGKRSATLCVD
jgi:hypothetical protein